MIQEYTTVRKKEFWELLFLLPNHLRTRGHSMKFKGEKLKPDKRKYFSTKGIIE